MWNSFSNSISNFSASLLNLEYQGYMYFGFAIIAFLLLEYFPGRRVRFSYAKLSKFIDKHLISHLIAGEDNRYSSLFKTVIFSVCFLLLIVSLANPRWDFEEIESFKPNVNLVFLLDLSKSMDAEDEKPSRLKRAKQEIQDIMDSTKGINFGIVAFANQAHIISPLTNDKKAIEYLLPSITTDLIPVQGSNLEAAIKSSDLMLSSVKGGINYVLLLSDGDIDSQKNPAVYRTMLENGTLLSMSFGTTSGAPIPHKSGGFLKYQNKMVITKTDETFFRNLTGKENYIKSSYLDEDIEYLKSLISVELKAEKERYQTMRIWRDEFYIPLAMAMILLLPFFSRGVTIAVTLLICFSAISGFGTQAIAQDSDENDSGVQIDLEALKIEKIKEVLTSGDIFRNENQKAERDFYNNEFIDAEAKFDSNYNKGIAAYRAKDFKKAESYFQESMKEFKEGSKDYIDALYNLGNANLSQLKPKEAIDVYEKLLKIDEEHTDANHNLELAKKLLKDQQKKQQQRDDKRQQNQQKNQQNQNNKDNQSQDKGDNQSSGKDDKGEGKGADQKSDQDKRDRDKDEDKKDGKNGDQEKDDKSGSNDSDKNGDGDDKKNQKNKGKGDKNKNNDQGNENNDSNSNPQEQGDQKSGTDSQDGGGSNDIKIDPETERMFNRLSGDPQRLLKNRIKKEAKDKDSDKSGKNSSSGGRFSSPDGLKPW